MTAFIDALKRAFILGKVTEEKLESLMKLGKITEEEKAYITEPEV